MITLGDLAREQFEELASKIESLTEGDPGYEAFLSDTARGCSCCGSCWECPCGGCVAGGVCDDIPCRCFGEDPEDPADYLGHSNYCAGGEG